MKTLSLTTVLLALALVCVPSGEAVADVFAHNVRITQPDSDAPFDARFDDATGAAIRFVLSDRADSVVVVIKLGATTIRTLKGTAFAAGDTSLMWDGLDDLGAAVGSGSYTVQVSAYDQGYGTFTTIYDADHGLFTRGVTAIQNPALKNFGFIYSADNGGYGGNGTGVTRHSADGRQWGNAKGVPKLSTTGIPVGPSELRYSSESDWEGYVYLMSRTLRQIYRYHTDSLNVTMIDSSGYQPFTVEGLGIRGTGANRYIGIASVYYIFGFPLGNNDSYFGNKDTLVYGDSAYAFYDVTFGRDMMMYATFYHLGDSTAKPGVAKFDMTSYTGTPFTLADTVWTATVDSGRPNTLDYYMNPNGTTEADDWIYFVNVDIGGGSNPGAGVGLYAITDLEMASPTLTYAYQDVGNNNTQFRTDVTADAVGNAVYFENTTENVAIISPPTGPNSFTYDSPATILVIVSESIAAVRIDADSDYVADRSGDTTTVIGVVNSINPTATSNRWQYYIQDETGGIAVTKGSETGGGTVYNIGDRIAVKGYVGQFNGLTQLNVINLATDVQLLGTGFTVTPQVVTLAELLANPEDYESEFIQLNGVGPVSASQTWGTANSNFSIWNGMQTLILRIDSDTDLDGSTAPVWPVNVSGPFIQFDSSPPFSGGYQIQPNFRADFTENVAVAPLPDFPLRTPTDGMSITLNDTIEVTFSWDRAIDLNNDGLIYQWAPVGFSAVTTLNSGADTFLVRTGLQLRTYLGASDTVVLKWTAKTKDAGPIVNNTDTISVTLIRGTLTGVGAADLLPEDFALMQNYPNPFNPTTNIRFAIPTASNVVLRVYNILGQEVATLFDGFKEAGYIDLVWSGRDDRGGQVASGVYLYRIEARAVDGARTFVKNMKMVMMK